MEGGASIGVSEENFVTNSVLLVATNRWDSQRLNSAYLLLGWPLIGYVQIEEQRPRLLLFNLTENILIENIILQDSPYHTLYLDAVNHVEVRHISIINRRTYHDGHSFVDLTGKASIFKEIDQCNMYRYEHN